MEGFFIVKENKIYVFGSFKKKFNFDKICNIVILIIKVFWLKIIMSLFKGLYNFYDKYYLLCIKK